MADFETSVPSSWDRARTFAYLADFRHVAEWDPAIASSVLVSGSPGEPGACYDVTFSMAGKQTTLSYTAVEIQPDQRIVMRAETDALISLDTIEISDPPVHVNYRAEIELKGARKLADPVADFGLTRSGKKAAAGLADRLGP